MTKAAAEANETLVRLQEEPWLLDGKHLSALFSKLAAVDSMLSDHPGLGIDARRRDADGDFDEPKMEIKDGVAAIPVNGILMKKVPEIFKYYGIGATSYLDIAANVKAAVADPTVHTIHLKVESPGGQVSGVDYASDEIWQARSSGKKVVASIEDIGASGAYWLASQAQEIFANPGAMVGSIGVYTAYADFSKMAEDAGVKVHVISTGEHKGMGVFGAKITDSQLKAMQEVIDKMGEQFVSAVTRGRGKDRAVAQSWASGRVWLGAEAKALGLIDQVGKFKPASSAVRMAASIVTQNEGERAMDEKEIKAREDAARAESKAAEQKRLKDLKAAFPDDQAFAFEQFEAGASVDQAKVAYCDVLQARASALRAENEELKKKPAAPKPAKGAPPISGSTSPEASTGDFMSLAKEYKREHKCSFREAASFIANTQPEVFKAYQEACVAAGPEFSARKKALELT